MRFGSLFSTKRREEKERKRKRSLKYAIKTGDWSHWSGTELALAYIMTPYIGRLSDLVEIGKELDRRGIRR